MKYFLGIFLGLFSTMGHTQDCVILLHGLARTAASMNTLEQQLAAAGYYAININYPSRQHAIEELAPLAIEAGLEQCQTKAPEKIHFVTHSLGGILVRYYLQQNTLDNLGHTVMLGPPNQGSEVVDKLKTTPGFYALNGPAGMQLGTTATDTPNTMGPANFSVGIIAGTRSINLMLSTLIPGVDDGKVAVARTHLENETDFISLPVTHPLMMNNAEVIRQTLYFLENGYFLRVKE